MRLLTPHRISSAPAQAPALDGVMTYFIVLPPVLSAVAAGWSGFVAALLGQQLALLAWTGLHELAHPRPR